MVTTRKGIEGIAAINQTHALIVDDAEEFIEALVYLIDHQKERKQLGANAFELVENQYDWEIIGKRLNRLFTGLKNRQRNVVVAIKRTSRAPTRSCHFSASTRGRRPYLAQRGRGYLHFAHTRQVLRRRAIL